MDGNNQRFFINSDNDNNWEDSTYFNKENYNKQNNFSEPVSNNNYKPKKKMGKKILVGLLIIIVLVGIILGSYFLWQSFFTPRKVFEETINEVFNFANNKLSENQNVEYDNDTEALLLNGNLKVESDLDYLKPYNNYSYIYNIGFDSSKQQFDIGLGMNENNTNRIKANIYSRNSKLYVGLPNIYNNLVELGSYDGNVLEEVNNKEIKKEDITFYLDKLKNSLLNNLNKNNFGKEKATIKVDEDEIKVTRLYYKLDNKEYRRLLLAMEKDLEDDEEVIDKVKDNFDLTKREAKEFISDLFNNLADIDLGDLKIEILMKGSIIPKVIGGGISYNDKDIVLYTNLNNKETLVIDGDDLEGTLKKVDDEVSLTMQIDDLEIEGNFIIENGIIDGKFKIVKAYNKIEGTILLEKGLVGSKRANYNLKLNLMVTEKLQKYNLNINWENLLQVKDKLDDVNLANAKRVEEISDSEFEDMSLKIDKALKGSILETMINAFRENFIMRQEELMN